MYNFKIETPTVTVFPTTQLLTLKKTRIRICEIDSQNQAK